MLHSPRSTPLTTTTSRRSLLRAAAWTTPSLMVAASAPAFATSAPVAGPVVPPPTASCEVTHRLAWHTTAPSSSTAYTLDSRPTMPGVDPVRVTITTEFVDARPSTDPAHYSFTQLGQKDATYGVDDALKLAMTKVGTQVATMRVTFQFSRPVSGLTFVVTDIDSNDNAGFTPNQRDRVWIAHVNGASPTGRLAVDKPSDSRVSGQGVSGNPWTNTTGNATNDSTRGNVRVRFVGEVKNFRLDFENFASTSTGTNSINVGGLHFTTDEPVC